jgi:hypothetical protein
MALTLEEQAELQELEQDEDVSALENSTYSNINKSANDYISAGADLLHNLGMKVLKKAPEITETASRSLLSGLTGGISEPVVAAASAPITAGHRRYNELRGQGADFITALKEGLAGATDPSELEKAVRDDLLRREQLKGQYPEANAYSEVLGMANPIGVTSNLAATATGLIPRMAGAKMLPKAVNTASRIAEGGLGTAAISATQETADQAGQALAGEGADYGQIAKGAWEQGKSGVAISGAIEGALGSIKVAPIAIRKLISSFLEIPENVLTKYSENFRKIEAAPSKEDIVLEVDNIVNNLKNDFDNKRINKDTLNKTVSELKKSVLENLADARSGVREKLKGARERLGESYSRRVDELKRAADTTTLADDVLEDIGDLKQQVIDRKKEAVDLLENAKGEGVSYVPIVAEINNQISKLKIGGVKAIGQTSKAAIKELEKIRDDIREIPNKNKMISFPHVKQILESLDKDINYAIHNNQFSEAFDGAAARIRNRIDTTLKNKVPDYKYLMEVQAKETGLLKNLNKTYSGRGQSMSKLKSVLSPQNAEQAAMLEELGLSTGRDYKKVLGQKKAAFSTLSTETGKQSLKKGLPESKEVRDLEFKYSQSGRNKFKNNIVESATQGKNKEYQEAVRSFDEAKKAFDGFSNIEKKGSTETVNSYVRSMGDKHKRLFQKLSGLSNKDFIDILDDISLKESFQKNQTRGSKRVNLFSIISGSLGFIAKGSPEAAAAGTLIGAPLGAMVDKFGAPTAKAMLRFMGNLSETPTAKLIKNSGLPNEAKDYLIDQMRIHGTQYDKRESITERLKKMRG